MDLSNMEAVKFRVAALEAQFLHKTKLPNKSFQKKLDKALEMAKMPPQTQQTPKSVSSEVKTAGSPLAPEIPPKSTQPDAALAKAIAAQVARPLAGIPSAKQAAQTYAAAPMSLEAMIREAAETYQVDPKLVAAVAQAESGGNQAAISDAGAIGVMQLMPGTAADLGVDPYDKKQNIEGGAKYLRELLDTFGGDVRKAVAAYNAGPGAVKNYGGVPPYRETENYVNRVLDLYQ